MVEIKGVSYKVAWDALATIEFVEACGFKYMDEVSDLRSLFGMDADEGARVSTKAMRNLVHFCHVALKTAHSDFPHDYRALFNEMNGDDELTKTLLTKSMEVYLAANQVPEDDSEGKSRAAG